MIRKQQKRAARGKQTAFRVNGQEVDQKRIARFARRKGTNWENHSRDNAAQPSPEPGMSAGCLLSHCLSLIQPGTPTDMSCYTPDGTDRASTLSPLPEFRSIRRNFPLFSSVSFFPVAGDLNFDQWTQVTKDRSRSQIQRRTRLGPCKSLSVPAKPARRRQTSWTTSSLLRKKTRGQRSPTSKIDCASSTMT